MPRFKSTPQKKLLGMVILFVLIPLFLLLYVLFVIDWRPSVDTIIIAIAIAALFFYLNRKYGKQIAAQQAEEAESVEAEPAEEMEEELPGEAGPGGEEPPGEEVAEET